MFELDKVKHSTPAAYRRLVQAYGTRILERHMLKQVIILTPAVLAVAGCASEDGQRKIGSFSKRHPGLVLS
jgi:hypothetical protein